MKINAVTDSIINGAMKVHSAVGAGLLEKAYDVCLAYELAVRNLHFERQVRLPVTYQGIRLDPGFRVDYVVESCVLIEIKAVEKLHPVHSAQLLSYLKLSGLSVGLLINFNVVHLRDGIRRLVNNYHPEAESDPLRPPRPLR